ncbi:MAG: hypothetical protein QOE58_743, partial [Actinomycetota bacterium]|nr:hypothetical protein [Actinomycetota bacterium]
MALAVPRPNSLLRNADIDMYKAKVSGNGHHIYGDTNDADGAGRLRTVEELRTARTGDQLAGRRRPPGPGGNHA